jgi:hypothetical protein
MMSMAQGTTALTVQLENLFEMQGFEESQGDLWLNHPLTQVLDYLHGKDAR